MVEGARQKEIAVDARGRTSLARVRTHDYRRYRVEEKGDGTLILTPVVSITAAQWTAIGKVDE